MSYQNISFSKDHNSEFYKVLRQRVNDYFKTKNITRHANAAMVFKTIALLSFYLIPFGFLLTFCISRNHMTKD